MIRAWLGRRGSGAPGSSDSLRGSLTSLVMASLPQHNEADRRTVPNFLHKILILLDNFANLMLLSKAWELTESLLV
jgi:hypothetical protein